MSNNQKGRVNTILQRYLYAYYITSYYYYIIISNVLEQSSCMLYYICPLHKEYALRISVTHNHYSVVEVDEIV